MLGRPVYADFLGTWLLLPETCEYEQGDPPASGLYRIEDRDGRLHFHMEWTDAQGAPHQLEFSGTPGAGKEPFAGGELADALAIDAKSRRELTSYAYYRGRECMVAQRQLDETGSAMRVTQLVRLDGGHSFANVSIYRRYAPN